MIVFMAITFQSRRDLVLQGMGLAFAVYSFWPMVVFAIQTRAYTNESLEVPVGMLDALQNPVGREARAHRAFALLMAVLFALSLQALAESLELVSLQQLISSLATFYILFLVSFVFVYVNNAPTFKLYGKTRRYSHRDLDDRDGEYGQFYSRDA